MNKKGMVDDPLDFLFTIFLAVFIFVFVGIFFTLALQNSHNKTSQELREFKLIDSAINNLRVAVYKGEFVDADKISEKIDNSRIIDGITITDCLDYANEVACLNDPAGISNGNCHWIAESCTELSLPKKEIGETR